MILVTGATGTVGREVARMLAEAGVEVGGVTRDPAAAQLPAGVHAVHADPSRPRTLAAAVDGVEAVLLSPRAAGAAAAELLSLLAARGTRRVVVLSAVTVTHPAGEERFARQFAAAEDVARASGLAWTLLRCADFAANALAWAPQIRAGGVVRGAHGSATTSPVHQRDIAAVAAAALTGPRHQGRAYLLTGPAPLSQRDRVTLIGDAIGRALAFEEVPPEQVRAAMLAQGLPEEIPARLLGSLADYAREPGPTSGDVPELLGRPALTFAEWAAENAAVFSA